MVISRSLRRFVAILLMASLVYAQLALASYACPTDSPALGTASGISMGAGEMALKGVGETSAENSAWKLDPRQPGMCVGHCQSASQNVDVKPAPSLAPALVVGFFTFEPSAQYALQGRAVGPAESPSPQADPPHAILHCCFRI
jgi:hypothetical protein